MLGTNELLIISVIFLLLFGARKVPELMKGVGEGIRALRNGVREDDESTKLKS